MTEMDSGRDTTPRPDPTKLTTEQLNREIDALRETLLTRIAHNVEIIELRTTNLQDELDRRLVALNTYLETESKCQTDVADRRFENIEAKLVDRLTEHATALTDLKQLIDSRFKMADDRAAEQKQDTKIAVDAAFLAARDAVSAQAESSSRAIEKQELSTSKQIDAIQGLITTTVAGLSQQITDLKERVDRSEGGANGERAGTSFAMVQADRARALMFGVIGTIIAAATVIVGVIVATR